MIPFYFLVQLISGDLFGYFQNRTFYETVNRYAVVAADQGFSRGQRQASFVCVCVWRGGGCGCGGGKGNTTVFECVDLPLTAPPYGPNFYHFHAVFLGKFGKIVCWHPLARGLAPPPTGNPGSAPALSSRYTTFLRLLWRD